MLVFRVRYKSKILQQHCSNYQRILVKYCLTVVDAKTFFFYYILYFFGERHKIWRNIAVIGAKTFFFGDHCKSPQSIFNCFSGTIFWPHLKEILTSLEQRSSCGTAIMPCKLRLTFTCLIMPLRCRKTARWVQKESD